MLFSSSCREYPFQTAMIESAECARTLSGVSRGQEQGRSAMKTAPGVYPGAGGKGQQIPPLGWC